MNDRGNNIVYNRIDNSLFKRKAEHESHFIDANDHTSQNNDM